MCCLGSGWLLSAFCVLPAKCWCLSCLVLGNWVKMRGQRLEILHFFFQLTTQVVFGYTTGSSRFGGYFSPWSWITWTCSIKSKVQTCVCQLADAETCRVTVRGVRAHNAVTLRVERLVALKIHRKHHPERWCCSGKITIFLYLTKSSMKGRNGIAQCHWPLLLQSVLIKLFHVARDGFKMFGLIFLNNGSVWMSVPCYSK